MAWISRDADIIGVIGVSLADTVFVDDLENVQEGVGMQVCDDVMERDGDGDTLRESVSVTVKKSHHVKRNTPLKVA